MVLLLLCCCQLLFGQGKLSDAIYSSIDAFIEHPSAESLKRLEADAVRFAKKPNKSKDELLALVILNCNKAYYENQFGDIRKAIVTYEGAWQSYQTNHLSNYDIVEYCLKPLGNLYTAVGDYESAENTIKQYFYIANVQQDQIQKIASLLNLSNVYQSSGRNDLAIGLLEKTISEEKLLAHQRGVLLNNLGTNYMLKEDFGKAKEKLEASIKLLASERNEETTLSNSYRNLAFIFTKDKKFETAEMYFKKAETLFFSKKQEPRKTAKFYYDKALLQFERGNLPASETTINTIFEILIPDYSKQKNTLPSQKHLYAETILLDALDLQATIYATQNKYQKALDCYALSFHIEDLFQSLLWHENSKIISQIRNRDRSEKCIALCNTLYLKDGKSIRLEKAFHYAERNKSSVLRAILASEGTISTEEKELSKQIQDRNVIILKEQQKLEQADIGKINAAINRQNELMLSLKALKKNEVISNGDINLEALFDKLENDNALMAAYFYGSERIYSFILENHTIKLNVLDNNNFSEKTIQDFLDFFIDSNAITNDVSGYNTTGNNLYKYLKLPTKSNHPNIIIIPDGLLNFVPFEALITQKTSTTNFAKMHYFLNDFKATYSNSARFYLDEKPFHYKNEMVLGVFPLFKNTDLELAYSKKELQAIHKDFKGLYLEERQATFENFKREAPHFSILHLSTHASSGDIHTPASLRFYDTEMLYSELYNLDVGPDLVVLSACETGLGKWYRSEGAMSISRGFQLAGAKNLLFSLWKVNDYTTSVFMEKFYSNLKKEGNYFEANHQAKLDFLSDETISNTKKSPYYWSAMVYYGTLETKYNPNYLAYLLAFLGAIGLFLLLQRFKK